MRTYYEVLRVPRDATAEELKAAYRVQAAVKHPDKGGTSAAFQELQAAYAELSDPQRRERYDLTLEIDRGVKAGTEAGQRLAEHTIKELEGVGLDLVRAGSSWLRRRLGVGR